jgi:general secretion pathway protein K
MPAEGVWSDPLPVPGGTVQARVVDLGGRFNLNALTHADPARARAARLALDELLATLDLAPELGAEIAALLRPGPDGVRHRLAHLSELDRLARVDPAVRARLAPFVVAAPDAATRVNVNRASPEVFASVLEGVSLESARAVLARAPFDSVDAVLAQPELRAVAIGPARERLAVESDWFLAQARVRLDGVERFYVRLVGASGSRYDARYVSQGTFHSTASRWLAPTISD